MSKKIYECIEITDLKDMLNKTKNIYGERPAFKIRNEDGNYRIITHREVRDNIDYLGTALISLGLKGKKIAVIGENRYEWEIAYLSVVCGTGIIVPLDKSLPANELESLIERSGVEAIFFSQKYVEIVKDIKQKATNKLKHLISMDLKEHYDGIYSEEKLIKEGKKLVQNGNLDFINAKINPEEMQIMLFTSGTTAQSKVVALSHKNLCSNLMDIASVLNVNSNDVILSILPIHHVFECTVGFLFSLYKGAQTVFCDGIRHIIDNLKEYDVTVMACVPAIYERIFMIIRKKMEQNGKLKEILERKEENANLTMEQRREAFKDLHEILGGKIKLLICGAAKLDPVIHAKYKALGFNLAQGYGLTETSPVIAVETEKYNRVGSIGKTIPSVEAKLVDVNKDGIGELIVKGPNIMLGYFENEEATSEAIKDGWFYTGDLAQIDDEGYIYICGRKKSVIVLKNGKNIFPEEMETLINKIEGVKESFVFGRKKTEDKDDIKINAKIVIDKQLIKDIYNVTEEADIYEVISNKIKEINKTMPMYKAIRGIILSEEELIKTTTNKIKRQANLDEIEKLND